ncbi:MAG: FeoB-associated Cys-rich membrane protein [Cytophagales bacterium]
MLQNILVITAFLMALFYMLRLVYKNFFSKEVHCPGCSGCSSIDFASIEKDLENKFRN